MQSRENSWRSVVGVALILITLIGVLIVSIYQLHQAELARDQQRRNREAFAEVKSGQSEVSIHSPDLVAMLVGDEDCIRNLTTVYFFSADLNDPRFAEVSKLTNVSDIWIYDCSGVEGFLNSIKGMPSIETLSFESIRLTDGLSEKLTSFPNLKKVHFEQELDGKDIDTLRRLVPNATIEVLDVTGVVQRIPTAATN